MSKSSVTPSFNDENSNTSGNPSFDEVLAGRLGRRQILQAAIAASGAGLVTATTAATPAPGATPGAKAGGQTLLGFKAVPKSIADKVLVPEGYTAQVIYALGDPLDKDTPAFRNDGSDQSFERRAGDHHDGMEWFSLSANGRPSRTYAARGLLAVNHEATTDEKLTSFFIHADGGKASLPRPAAEADKEIAIHGLSVVEVQAAGGKWSYKQDSRFNRRITPDTEVELHGPVRGSQHAVTRFSPDGTRARGTINNCGTGKTPWNTFVSGEENWFGYFNRGAKDDEVRGKGSIEVLGLQRYGRNAGAPSRHGWETAGADDRFARWNISQTGASARDDYRNEMNTFGYVVEMDPYEPETKVRKRTALGRFAHESVSFAKPVSGEPIVAYMGDDARGEYIYKFVSDAKWDPRDANPGNRLAAGDKYLNKGTLFVARFKYDGSGEWIELSPRNPILAVNPGFEFKTDADVCVYTRLAADIVGATRMDRPEWSGVNPKNGEIYFTLTNNSNRTPADVDAANPRAYVDQKDGKPQRGNVNGHIARVADGKPAAKAFRWDVFVFGAEAGSDASKVNLSNLTDANDMSSPDGLVFSQATGLCWIQTDDGAYTDKSNCMMLAAMPGRVGDGAKRAVSYEGADGNVVKTVETFVGKELGETHLKRFLVGPRDSEITGWCETPDGRAIFINIQHPGENTKMADVANADKFTSQWPANAGYGAGKRPRSATIVITRNDGGVIGA